MNRYIQTFAFMLAAWLTASNGMAQEQGEGEQQNSGSGSSSKGVRIHGNVYGGGNNADVQTNTAVNIGAGQVDGNVYGGGNVGDVGTIDKSADYNYTWTQTDGSTDNVAENNKITSDNANTGICTVNITGGTIGVEEPADATKQGNVFGAGKGEADTWWCEKAIAYATSVAISNTAVVKGNVYGGGQIGRVEDDTKVEIGTADGADEPDIRGSVFGAGAGLQTHGYSALVRGNAAVTVQGKAKVGGSVYGGGETASVGRFTVVGGLPKHPESGGKCTVTIQDNAKIGTSGTGHNVYGACKGVTPAYNNTVNDPDRSKSMQLSANKPKDDSLWSPYKDEYGNEDSRFIWRYYASEDDYKDFLQTLALTSHPTVTIDESATVYGSVYGGGERGLTLGNVDVNITGGIVEQDVYGGGALANSNAGNWDADSYAEATVTAGETLVTGMYTRSGAGTDTDPYVYTETADTKAAEGTIYYRKGKWADATKMTANYTTTVNLLGGLVKGDAYGGGLGQKTGFNGATSDIEATVWGDINVYLGEASASATAFDITHYSDEGHTDVVKSGRIFGCNNLLGSPQGDVTVTVYKTVSLDEGGEVKDNKPTKETHTYEVAAVYGGGNLASFTTAGKKAHVIIHGCGDTSIETVYGGGNAAPVPETQVDVYATYEIENLFGGGNGKDKYKNDSGWQTNPGADINGNTNTIIYGGTVHEAYGGSNEKGTIHGDVAIDVSESTGNESCPLDVAKLVGAGKNADVNGDLIMVMGCKPLAKIPLLFAGADNANVNGDVELTITSGNFGQVFGGNNAGGAIYGHIKLNIEETGDCETPITIDSLYLGGNQAAYSVYGYKTEGGKLVPQSADELKTAIAAANEGKTDDELAALFNSAKYDDPELNIVACTYIGQVFGGGYGTGAYMYADPKVNINMIQGSKYSGVHTFMTTDPRVKDLGLSSSDNPNSLGIIGTVYGGGNAADVYGDPTVNICTASTVDLVSTGATGNTVLGAYIVGSVFGGGKGKADTYTCEKAMVGIDGDGVDNPDGGTTVNIYNGTVLGSVYGGGEIGRVEKNTMVTIGQGDGESSGTPTSAPYIRGNVFGAGKGLETHGYAALVRGNPTVTIQGNAKVLKSVYGGGEIASVARYDVVNGVPQALAQVKEGQHSGWCTVNVRGYAEIGPETEMKMYHEGVPEVDDAPDDAGHVFAAGRGVLPENYTYADNEHRPKRMLRYDSETIDKITYWEYAKTYPADYSGPKDIWQYFKDEDEYFDFIQTLALATQTSATIGGNALVKGSVYGGSENGLVQYDTNVTIEGDCQIGCGKNTTGRHPDPVWDDDYTVPDDGTDLECASWEYDGKTGAPYDPYAKYQNPADGKYYYDTGYTNYADGGAKIAKDGHTYYGNVFGGGSGSVPYFDTNKHESRYIMTAGWVKGNTHVTINGGHILTNVYGGCEATNVDGTAYVTMTGGTLGVPRTLAQFDAHPVTCYLFGAGKGDQRVFYNKSTNVKDVVVSITGGRIYGSVFGGGEDGHVLRDVTMTIGQQTTTGEGKEAVTTTSGPTIGTWGTSYVDGNVFGGGRGFGGDAYTAGNVAGSVKMEIKGGTILGSIYGGGRLGSVGYGLFDEKTNGQPTPGYGEMRANTDTEDGFTDGTPNFFTKGRGHIDITISGGTIGNTHEYIVPNATNIAAAGISETDISKWTTDNEWKTWKTYHHISKTEFDASGRLTHTKGGNVFAGGMGRFYQLDGTTPISVIDWWKLGNVKSTKLTITGGTIKSNVYGGGELGMVQGTHTSEDSKAVSTEVTVSGGVIGTEVEDGGTVKYTYGSVFGGGYGSILEKLTHTSSVSYPKYIAGRVKGSTAVTISGSAAVKASVYGGGEMAAVGESKVLYTSADQVLGETLTGEGGNPMVANTYVTISGGTIGKAKDTENDIYYGGAKMGNVYGGGSGYHNTVRSGHIYGNTNVSISGGTIYHNIYGGGAYGTVGDFTYETQTEDGAPKVYGVNGLHSDRTGTGTANVTITGGTIGYDGKENGMVFGSSRGDINRPGERDDHTAWTYETHVTIGTPAVPASGTEGEEGYVPAVAARGPAIKGTVYGSGENGHVFHDTYVTVNGGTIGIADSSDPGYTVTSGGTTYSGAAYPYRGNVYGGGCGTDKYYSGDVPSGQTAKDGEGDLYNQLAGIVYGNTNVSITGGLVVRNVYGAGAMGSVGKFEKNTTTNAITFSSGGTTNINVRGGTIGGDGSAGDGNVYGAARGDKDFTDRIYALVKETNVTISGTTEGTRIMGNVYGGGEVGNVHANTAVTVEGGAIAKNVFGGGKGVDNLFTCEQAMVGVEGEGAGAKLDVEANKNKGTIVTISNGTVGTLNSGTLVEGTGNVYGGGEIGRVEWNTQVMIGSATGASTPVIYGNVFGAGKGLETHGYSALVRGNSTVTVQGDAKVGYNVYGGGENSTVGRYWVKGINNSVDGAPAAPADLPDGMPYKQQNGGICRVAIQGNAEIGYLGIDDKGHVFGAGKGVEPHFVASGKGASQKMVKGDSEDPDRLVNFTNNETTGQTAEEAYLEFLQTLSLVTYSYVTIDGSAKVKGSVFGGSESGFVQHDANVTIQGSDCVIGTDKYGNIFGGGKGLEYFAEAGKVKGNTKVTISSGTVKGNVYGGGRLGDVGTITKPADYNYTWKKNDGSTANAFHNNTITGTNDNTGICTVSITDGTIGISGTVSPDHGNVFGAGKGTGITWWCEKAIAYATSVSVSGGTVNGNVYGGGQVGRVEDDAKVVIGVANATGDAAPAITGSVFGAGAGLNTHGYSALVRGNSDVTVQGAAQVGGSVYGGGEIASVGRFKLISGLPSKPQAGGTCTVKIQDNAKIGTSGTGHNVYGACKGVTPAYVASGDDRSKSMQLYTNRPDDTNLWAHYNNDESSPFIWRYYASEADYKDFLQTLALTSNTHVTIDESSDVYGSVYGGGERGITLGGVDVNMKGGTVHQDVYGGGSLADSNRAMWDAEHSQLYNYVDLELIPGLSLVTGYYTAESADAVITTPNAKAESATGYYAKYKTAVNLTGGTVERNVYGGGLGQLAKAAVAAQEAQGTEGEEGYVPAVEAQDAVSAVEAKVYGDVLVELNKPTTTTGEGEGATTTTTYGDCEVQGIIFGCNNLNGSPQAGVTVHVYKTVAKDSGTVKAKPTKDTGSYELAAVYGGGNLAAYYPDDATTRATAVANVIIDGCGLTSIETVYGGGNAASVPETDVVINGTYEIGQAFGGGNGADEYAIDGKTYENPGANVGYMSYAYYTWDGMANKYIAHEYTDADGTGKDASTKDKRVTNYGTGYGTGKAHVTVLGGTVHSVYAGSNTRGNIRVESRATLVDADDNDCEFDVTDAYGGGRNALQDGDAKLDIGCISGLGKAYGGASNADVNGDVILNITNGTYGQVFGGNDMGGCIRGSITVNVEETGCRPVIIGELYGGGNQAAYSIYGYKQVNGKWMPREASDGLEDSSAKLPASPTVNVRSFTSIGTIYGGGYGASATMVGDPTVNVDVLNGKYAATEEVKEGARVIGSSVKKPGDNGYDATKGFPIPSHAIGAIGAIRDVFGGGNAAEVVGTTHVNIGTEEYVPIVSVATGSDVSGYYTRTGEGTSENPYVYNDATDTAVEETTYYKKVEGVDIRGNVYGGGNNAEVTGDTKVVIGKKAE